MNNKQTIDIDFDNLPDFLEDEWLGSSEGTIISNELIPLKDVLPAQK